MYKQCWLQVIVPLLIRPNTALLCITTISDEQGNHCTDLIERKVIPAMMIKMVCPDCERSGEAIECKHMEWRRPKWQATTRDAFIQRIYGEENQERYAMESKGFQQQKNNSCFPAKDVDFVFQRKRYAFDDLEPYLFLTVDPSAGSVDPAETTSDFAWVTHGSPGMKVLGAESIPIQDYFDWKDRLIAHLRKCFLVPAFKGAKLVVFVECNLRGESFMVKQIIQEHFPFACFPNDHDDKVAGLFTTNQVKMDMQKQFRIALYNRLVHLPAEFVTTDPNPIKLLTNLRTQLLDYSKVSKAGKDPLGKTRFTFSGKGPNNGKKDDLAVVMQLGCYYVHRFFNDKNWIHYHV